MAVLLLTSCSHAPVRPGDGEPVRVALVKVKSQTASVAQKVVAKVPEMKVEMQSLQDNLAAAELAFMDFEKKYDDAAKKVTVLEKTVEVLTGSRNFWRGVTYAALGTVVLCLALLIIPKIPL